jgi:hypothetical protein
MRNPCGLLLLLLASQAFGQDIHADNAQRLWPVPGGGAGSDMIMTVHRANSSRLSPPEPEPLKLSVQVEGKATTRIVWPGAQFKSCQADVELHYEQRNTEVRVDGIINHDECPESVGTLDIMISYVNAKGELDTQGFTEQWQSSNAAEQAFFQDYVIDAEASLSRVQSRNIRCSCRKPPPAE